MGRRPGKPAKNFCIRLYTDELEAIAQAAEKVGKKRAQFIRDTLLANLEQAPALILLDPVSDSPPAEEQEKLVDESIKVRNGEIVGRTLFARENFPLPITKKRVADSAGEGSEVLDVRVKKRTGHVLACRCLACKRLRELLSTPK